MKSQFISPAALLIFCVAHFFAKATAAPTTDPATELSSTNSPTANERQRLLLISIDGYRYDYTDLHKPPFLTAFREQGASLESLRPAFPSKTFPNHLTLVTGMVPARHGIVFNSFYAPDLEAGYSLSNAAAITRADFYLAKPLWVIAEQQGLSSAIYFWPGSEAAIDNTRPSIFKKYNKKTPVDARIDELLQWVARRDASAPQFMSLYFSQVDDAGHDYGPESHQTRTAIHQLDAALARLWQGIQVRDPNLNVIIVSDHGMYPLQGRAALAGENVDTEQKVEPLFTQTTQHLRQHYGIIGNGPTVQFYLQDKSLKREQAQAMATAAVTALNAHAEHFSCMTPASAPAHFQIQTTARMGDFICVAEALWSIATDVKEKFSKGNHGWPAYEWIEPEAKNMHAIFYARGPAFRNGYRHPTQDNVHVMPLMAHILGVELSHPIDGKLEAMAPLLKISARD